MDFGNKVSLTPYHQKAFVYSKYHKHRFLVPYFLVYLCWENLLSNSDYFIIVSTYNKI